MRLIKIILSGDVKKECENKDVCLNYNPSNKTCNNDSEASRYCGVYKRISRGEDIQRGEEGELARIIKIK